MLLFLSSPLGEHVYRCGSMLNFLRVGLFWSDMDVTGTGRYLMCFSDTGVRTCDL